MVTNNDKRNKSVVLSLGGNIGDVKRVLEDAISCLEKRVGKLVLASEIYKTEAWGVEDQPDFLNQTIVLETSLTPHEVLEICLNVEKELGRDRMVKKKWQERVVDIDVLFYEDEVIDSIDLILPHPYLHERNFVLVPLAEIIPEFVHPILKETIFDLKESSSDKLQVIKYLA